MKLVEACGLEDIPPGRSRPVRLGTVDIALFNVEGSIHALENSCPHQGAALSAGSLCGKVVSCPAHGWRFDVTTGALVVAPEKRCRSFPVAVTEGKVMVQLDT